MTGISKTKDAPDPNFRNYVIKAGHAFIAAKSRDPAIEGAPLAEWLRSDKPLGAA